MLIQYILVNGPKVPTMLTATEFHNKNTSCAIKYSKAQHETNVCLCEHVSPFILNNAFLFTPLLLSLSLSLPMASFSSSSSFSFGLFFFSSIPVPSSQSLAVAPTEISSLLQEIAPFRPSPPRHSSATNFISYLFIAPSSAKLPSKSTTLLHSILYYIQ